MAVASLLMDGATVCGEFSLTAGWSSLSTPYRPDVASFVNSSVLGSAFENPTARYDVTRGKMYRPANPEIVKVGVIRRCPVTVVAHVDERVPRRQGGVGLAEIGAFREVGAVGFGIGGPLVGDAARGGPLGELALRAQQFVEACRR